jgi:hypothetical protein
MTANKHHIDCGESPRFPGSTCWAIPHKQGYRFVLTLDGRIAARMPSYQGAWDRWGVNPPLRVCVTPSGKRANERPGNKAARKLARLAPSRVPGIVPAHEPAWRIGDVVGSGTRRARIIRVEIKHGMYVYFARELKVDGSIVTYFKRAEHEITVTHTHWKKLGNKMADAAPPVPVIVGRRAS